MILCWEIENQDRKNIARIFHLFLPFIRFGLAKDSHIIELFLCSADASLLVFRANGLVMVRDPSILGVEPIQSQTFFLCWSTKIYNISSDLMFFFILVLLTLWGKHCFWLPCNKGLVSALYSGQSCAAITAGVMTWSHLMRPRSKRPVDLLRGWGAGC